MVWPTSCDGVAIGQGMVGRNCGQVNRSTWHTKTAIAASRTPPWLPSGWGCRRRHLSRARGSPDRRSLLWLCRCSLRRLCQVEDARAHPAENSARYRDGPETFGTQSPPLDLDVQADKFGRADKLDTEFPLASVVARPVHREQPLPATAEPGLHCHHWLQ